MKRIIILLSIVLLIFTFTACDSDKDNILSRSKDIIDEDLNIDSNIGMCYYNKDLNIAYVKFFSTANGEDDAVIMFADNIIYYGHVFSTISEDDYEKIIEYGDYALYSYQATVEGDDWEEIKEK